MNISDYKNRKVACIANKIQAWQNAYMCITCGQIDTLFVNEYKTVHVFFN